MALALLAQFTDWFFVIFLDAVFDLNTQCGTGITFAVFCAAS
jgi:hypothetical protein